MANELRNRANEWLEGQETAFNDKVKAFGITDDLRNFDELAEKKDLLLLMGEKGIKTDRKSVV